MAIAPTQINCCWRCSFSNMSYSANRVNMRSWSGSRRVSCSSSTRGGLPAMAPPEPHFPNESKDEPMGLFVTSRRTTLLAPVVVSAVASVPGRAEASKLGSFVDDAWEKGFGGGPADLYYPDQFLGTWDVSSTLVQVQLPLGPEFVPNMQTVNRAQSSDLNKTIVYPMKFVEGPRGRIIADRAFNTASLIEIYTGKIEGMSRRITWDPSDPNVLSVSLPGGLSVRTRVTRRSEEEPEGRAGRLETSEYFEQVFEDPNQVSPRIKASQCFTKFLYRSPDEAKGGPEIVATQTVADFLTPYDDEALMMRAMNKPVTIYTYRMAFRRPAAAGSAEGSNAG